MRAILASIFTLSLVAASAVQAAPSYNYVELDYIDLDIDPLSGDGFAIGGSGLVSPNLYLLGRYSDADADETISGVDVDLELQQISLGIGAQTPLQNNDNISVFGQLTYEDIEAEFELSGPGGFAAGDADDSGFAVEGGGRFQVAPQFELSASVRYIDVEEFYDGEFGFRVGGEWRALPWLALSVDYDQVEATVDDVEQIQVGARVYWDQLQ